MPDVLSPDATKIPSPKTADDINDMFNELDKEPEVKEVKKEVKKESIDDDKKDDKKDDEKDDELELKDVEEDEDLEKLDLKEEEPEIDAPPRKQAILKVYPEIFKKFPFLEKMMYRDREYTELFGSFDNAREIAENSKDINERAEIFNSFESQLLAGDTKEILRSVKDSDSKAFDSIVDNYLPALAAVDKEAYFHVVGNLNRRLIMEMVQEANDLEKTDLDRANDIKQAALYVNQFIFGNSKFVAPTNRVQKQEESSEKKEIETERLAFLQERFETSRDDLQLRVDNKLRATISEYIDPKNVMTSYVKKNAVEDAMKILTSSIAEDQDVVKNLDKFWRSAFETKFSKDSLDKIQSFYLSKAKKNLKTAIIKARTEALKDLSPRREKEEDVEEETPIQRRTITPGRPSQPKGKNEMKRGESVTDFFMRD